MWKLFSKFNARRLLLWCGFVLSLVVIGVGGYRSTNYSLAMQTCNYRQAAESPLGDRALALYNLGLASWRKGDALAAKEALDGAFEACLDEEAEVTPERREPAAELKFALGNLSLLLQDSEGAIEAYKESLRLNPDNLQVKYNLEFLLTPRGGEGKGKSKLQPGSSQGRKQGL